MVAALRNILSSDGLNLVSEITISNIIISLIITFILSMFIFYIYKKTYSGVLYSKNFNISLVMASLISSMVLLAISSSLALALGMLGALSIIRFRTAVKDPKDVTFLFWAIAVGVVDGIGIYKLSITGTLFIGAVIILLTKRINIHHPFLVNLKTKKETNDKEIKEICRRYCTRYDIRSITLDNNEKEILIEVRVKKGVESILIKELEKIKGVMRATMFSYEGELEE